MWFKQLQVFELTKEISYQPEQLAEQLENCAFTPCLPSLPSSQGWAAPIDLENAPLVHGANSYMMLCMQIEEKVLPAAVIRHALDERIKHIQHNEERKVYRSEKQTLKDDITQTLMPRAFSKYSRMYAYIDTKRQWLFLDTTSAAKTELFFKLLQKAKPDFEVKPFDFERLAPTMTRWLFDSDIRLDFEIEKDCVLQDFRQQSRVIRCKQQDLFASSILSLLKDGCEVKQLALSWENRVDFSLSDEFTLPRVKFSDEVLSFAKDNYGETEEQRFDADFYIMAETLGQLFEVLVAQLTPSTENIEATKHPEMAGC